jgi:beta-1,4-mannosyltransferase
MFFVVVVVIVLWALMNVKFIFRIAKIAGTVQKIDLVVRHRAVVVVGGDFARSPRMQYHAVSLASSKLYQVVSLVGVDDGNKLCEALETTDGSVYIEKRGLLCLGKRQGLWGLILSVVEKCPVRPLRWLLVTVCRVSIFIAYFGFELYRVMSLSLVVEENIKSRHTLVTLTVARLVLCQTPPAVPFVVLVKLVRCMVVACVVLPLRFAVMPLMSQFVVVSGQRAIWSRIVKAVQSPKVVVDWHNFGFTLLQVDLRPQAVVAIYKFFEKNFCCGDVNLTVSKAMQRALTTKEGNQRIGPFQLAAPVHVLYDTAPAFFSHVTRQKAIQQLRLRDANSVIANAPGWFTNPESEAAHDGLLIVSSTSWGSDDDYNIVVQALKRLDQHLNNFSDTSRLVKNVWLVVTGKGPTRERFETAVAAAQLSRAVTVSTAYFQSFLDYSTMLGAGDVGLSVHFSSSGLDLPMKCVDMLGAGLPVAAVAYECIEELVTTNSGWLFCDELSLFELLRSFLYADGQASLRQKSTYVAEHRELWEESWNRVVKPFLQE